MYVPITSEVTIKTGLVLKEISTERLFVVAERFKNGQEVSGEDKWELTPVSVQHFDQLPIVLARQELSQKYYADVDD